MGEETYERAFGQIRQAVESYGFTFSNNVQCMMDFECAERNAWKTVIGNDFGHQICQVHHCQLQCWRKTFHIKSEEDN